MLHRQLREDPGGGGGARVRLISRELGRGDELKAFRKLADLYAEKTDVKIAKELQAKVIVEICHDDEAQT
jgi:hypothetical protein